jgi:hypothetical protein
MGEGNTSNSFFVLGHNQNASGAGGFDAAGTGTATGHIPNGSKATFSNTDIGCCF